MLLILSNILPTPQTISWAKKSNQLLVSFKLDFFKAHDRVRLTIEWIGHVCSKECVCVLGGGGGGAGVRGNDFGILEEFVNTSKIIFVGEWQGLRGLNHEREGGEVGVSLSFAKC
jgi:hypothetical protein